jgi:cellulose synthase/poly-beta-1,6-N-acetylglucosamine synthase-like glycosyltransferase
MSRFLEISNNTLFWYYVTSNVAYLIMLVVALKTTARHHHLLESYRFGWMKETSLAPPITIIVPAHNEQKSIRVSVRKLLELDYPELEIVVVNDGSEDRTLDEM